MFANRRLPLLAAVVVFQPLFLLALPEDSNEEKFKAEYARALALLEAGKEENALKSFEKADKLHGGSCGTCRFEMAKIEMESGSYDDCVRNLDKALPNLKEPKVQAIAHNLKGVILMGLAEGKMDKLQKAQAEFTVARQLDPDDPTFLLN